MASKSLIFLVCVVVTATLMMGATQVEAQLIPSLPGMLPMVPGLPGMLPSLPAVPIISPLLGNLLNIVNIRGLVFCSGNASLGTNGTSFPVFPNAMVQLRCGNQVVATARTNVNGVFSLLADLLNLGFPNVASLISNCTVVVATPLFTCNANLPSTGALVSTGLQEVTTLLGRAVGILAATVTSLIGGVFTVITLVPTTFVFDATINLTT